MIAHYRRTQHRVSVKSKFLGAFKYRGWWTTLRGTGGLAWQVWKHSATHRSQPGGQWKRGISLEKEANCPNRGELQNVIFTLGT